MKHSWEYDSAEERKEAAGKLKERGSKYFMEGKYSLGQKLYRRGLDIVSDSSVSKEEDKELVRAVKLALHLNLAACHLKMTEPSSVISECDKVRGGERGEGTFMVATTLLPRKVDVHVTCLYS